MNSGKQETDHRLPLSHGAPQQPFELGEREFGYGGRQPGGDEDQHEQSHVKQRSKHKAVVQDIRGGCRGHQMESDVTDLCGRIKSRCVFFTDDRFRMVGKMNDPVKKIQCLGHKNAP